MHITFLLPLAGHEPIGGFKVVYEYANGLARRGHEVTVVHSPRARRGERSRLRRLRSGASFLVRAVGLRGGYRPDSWFRIDEKVRLAWVPSLTPPWIPDGDVVVATAWETAEYAAALPPSKGEKFYLIQHDESLFTGVNPARVRATWLLPLKKIVIARWLERMALDLGESCAYIPNGLDFSTFGLDVPIDARLGSQVAMMHHRHPWKGTADGLAALTRVRQVHPELRVTLFGLGPRPETVPAWATYVQAPPQTELRRIYNEAAIFVSPSWAEGWPLPPSEAMQCGAATCLTDIGGHREFAIDGVTSLFVPPREPETLARAICRLIEEASLRKRIAAAGHEAVQRFTWDRAIQAFEAALNDFSAVAVASDGTPSGTRLQAPPPAR